MRKLILSAFLPRYAITVAAMAVGFIFNKGFQLDRIGQLVFFSLFISLFFMAVWVVMYFIADIALRFWTADSRDTHNEAIVGVVCELLCFHSYIIFAFFIHFSSLYFDLSPSNNLSVAGVGGRMIIEGGELTLYGMSQALDFLMSSYITAALIHLVGTIYIILRKFQLKGGNKP
jgi:hypothetical protein